MDSWVLFPQDLDRIPQVVHVTDRICPSGISEQPQKVVVERPGHIARHRQVLVLLLAKPRDAVGDVDPVADTTGPLRSPESR